MTRSSFVLRTAGVTVAAAGFALAVGLGSVGAAHAESPTAGPTPSPCQAACGQSTTAPIEVPRTPVPTPTLVPSLPVQPTTASPAPPAKAAPAASAPASTVPPEPSATATEMRTAEATTAAPEETVSPSATASASATASTAPATASNWNKPMTKQAEATQAAAVTSSDGPDFGAPGLLAIMAGVLLVGLGGLSFAWWSRNRLSAH